MIRVALIAGVLVGLCQSGLHAASGDRQQNRSREFGPRQCGRADPTYIEIASETGGLPFFLSPAEVAESGHIMSEISIGSRELILWASATSKGVPRELAIPIDSSIKRFTIAASFDQQGGTLTVVGADGTVNPRPEGSLETILNCAHVLTLDKPAAGAWQARVVASGRFWLVAQGQSEISIDRAEFVKPGGRPGHDGLFRIQGQPLAGKPAMLRARASSIAGKAPEFAAISSEGRELQRLELQQVDDEEYVGTITLPDVPFRVAAIGVDSSGQTYQRLYGPLFHGELVELSIPATEEALVAGSTTPIKVTVRNHGPASRFHMVATDSSGRINRVEPGDVDVAEGADATVTVWIPVASSATPGSSISLTVTAEGRAARTTTNSVTRQYTVAPGR